MIQVEPLKLPPFNKEQLKEYAAISADDNLIHYDDATARQAGFTGVIVHGMLSMAALGNFLETRFPSDQYHLSRFKVRFRKAVYPGDILECTAEPKPDHPGAVTLALTLKNERGESVAEGSATISSRLQKP